jgi:hypothetical protein
MSEHNRIDRRTLLKIMGSAGATAVVSSACGTAGAESGAGLTGGKFDKTVALATGGPGGNQNWQPGDAVKFLPPQQIPTSIRR